MQNIVISQLVPCDLLLVRIGICFIVLFCCLDKMQYFVESCNTHSPMPNAEEAEEGRAPEPLENKPTRRVVSHYAYKRVR